MNKTCYGYIENIDSTGIHGWAIDGNAPHSPCKVCLYINDSLASTTYTHIERKDVEESLNIGKNCGFIFKWENMNLENCYINNHENPKKIKAVIEKYNIEIPQATCITESLETLDLEKISKKQISGNIFQLSTNAIKNVMCKMTAAVEPRPNIDENVKLIAYYLPQYHPIPENDEWWGAGFTEWRNTTQGTKYFKEHYQPHIPGELGYYDLRLKEIQEEQANLAKEYGIHGFCYYYYWFNGRKLLDQPIKSMLLNKTIDLPFCICWANENWSRRWDGSENEILIEQVHNEETDANFILDAIDFFKDERYICINGAPLLLVYRISIMSNPRRTAETWRRICKQHGFPDVHLCMVESFGLSDPYNYGFDSSVQFPPHGLQADCINSKLESLDPNFKGYIFDYTDVIKHQLNLDNPNYKRFPGVMTAWDNTARKKLNGNVFAFSTPNSYEIWLRGAIDITKQNNLPKEQFVFINAWNEWAEGAHLEPDIQNQRDYLKATQRALASNNDWQLMIEYARNLDIIKGVAKDNYINNLEYHLTRLDIENKYLLEIMGKNGIPKTFLNLKKGVPYSLTGLKEIRTGNMVIEQINNIKNPETITYIDNINKLYIRGWMFIQNVPLTKNMPTFISFTNTSDTTHKYFCLLKEREERSDVSESFKSFKKEVTLNSGFKAIIDLKNIQPGQYLVHLITRNNDAIYICDSQLEICFV